MSTTKQYLQQIRQTALHLNQIASNMQQGAIRLIQENPQIDGKFEDKDIANDTFFVILSSVNLQNLAENMISYCEERLSNKP